MEKIAYKWWAIHLPGIDPAHRLYEFVKCDGNKGLYWFRNRKFGTLIAFNHSQLQNKVRSFNMYPFLIEGGKKDDEPKPVA